MPRNVTWVGAYGGSKQVGGPVGLRYGQVVVGFVTSRRSEAQYESYHPVQLGWLAAQAKHGASTGQSAQHRDASREHARRKLRWGLGWWRWRPCRNWCLRHRCCCGNRRIRTKPNDSSWRRCRNRPYCDALDRHPPQLLQRATLYLSHHTRCRAAWHRCFQNDAPPSSP